MRRLLLVCIVVAGILLAACTPAPSAGTRPETTTALPFSLGLGRIPITIDENGKLGIEGFLSLEQIDQFAGLLNLPVKLSSFAVSPQLVHAFMQNGIQHIEMRQTTDGLTLLVNGKRLPGLSWKGNALDNVTQLTKLFGGQSAAIGDIMQKFAPLVRSLGLDIALKFPVPQGATPIPYASEEVAAATPAPPEGPPWLTAQFEVNYDERGVPSFQGISAESLQALFPGRQLLVAMDPRVIAQAQANNIQYIVLRSTGNGIGLYVNGAPLPSIVWDKESLSNAIDLWGEMNPGLSSAMLEPIRQIASTVLGGTDLQVVMHFPVAPGVEPIPVTLP
jgi:hypothetical protein